MDSKLNGAWKPTLPQELESSAQEFIEAIAADVYGITHSDFAPSLLCDAALLYAYLSEVDSFSSWSDKAVECLNLAIEQISDSPHSTRAGLHHGMAGIGWIIQHVSDILTSDDSEPLGALQSENDSASAIDQLLIRHLRQDPWMGDYDVISGLVGIGVYCLERLPREGSIRAVERVVDHLNNTAERTTLGITWFTPPERLPEWQRELCPSGYYNLGVAHGIPGVIQFLGEVTSTGISGLQARQLLEGAIEWLIARQRPPNKLCRYSSWFIPGQDSGESRLGWCYGDLGIAAVLHHTACVASRSDWQRMAIEIFNSCALRLGSLDDGSVRDASLCHGAAGIAHIFNRIYQTTGDTGYSEVANAWFGRALSMRQPEAGVGGFLAWQIRDDATKNPSFYPDASFLSGAIGAALALLSALHPIEPQWDRLLLLSGRANRSNQSKDIEKVSSSDAGRATSPF